MPCRRFFIFCRTSCACLDQCPCNARNAGTVGALPHQFFEIRDGRERQGYGNAVSLGFFGGHRPTLASGSQIDCKKLPESIGIVWKTVAALRSAAGHDATPAKVQGVGGAIAALAVHDALCDHAMNALGAVHRLRHPQIGGEAAQRVGVLARQVSFLAEQDDHVA
jgi:hypothetical protein